LSVIYLLTGAPGAGKSTVAVQRAIWKYAAEGRRVVANFPMDFAPICGNPQSKLSRSTCYVIPDRPTREDLEGLGQGGEHEEVAGLLIVDEAGSWLNARTWQGKDRDAIIDWLTQSRKRRWDVILIAQAAVMLDKQVREAVCETVVRIRRLDRWKILGVAMPRVHIAIVRYGLEQSAPVIERWIYRGIEAQQCFGSYRVFGADSAHYSTLTAWHTKFRYFTGPRWQRIAAALPCPWLWLAVGCLLTGIVYAFISPWTATERRYPAKGANVGGRLRAGARAGGFIPSNCGPEPVAIGPVAYGHSAEIISLAGRRRSRVV